MDQQRVEEKNEKEEQSEESESVTDRSEEEMSDMTIAFEWDKESAKNDDAKTYDPYFGKTEIEKRPAPAKKAPRPSELLHTRREAGNREIFEIGKENREQCTRK